MSKKVVSKRKPHPKATKIKFLNTIPYENGFHFYTSISKYSGITANSLSEFAAKLQVVPVESIDFHFQRKDFQKWVSEIIGDKELAERISLFGAARSAEDLRIEMIRIVQERLGELTSSSSIDLGLLTEATVPLKL